MKKLSLFTIALSMSVFGLSQKLEPEALSNAGEHMQGTDLKLDWTLGLNESETIRAGDNNLTQGVQQANLKVSTYVLDINSDISFKAYPNPSIGYITIEKTTIGLISYVIHELSGQKLGEGVLHSPLTQLDWNKYPPGTYIISLKLEGTLVGNLKIEKL